MNIMICNRLLSSFPPLLTFIITLLDLSLLTRSQLFRPGQEPQNVINSLLTPILPRSECSAAVDNRIGLCMPKSACLSSGGYVAGTCGFVLSCCVHQGTCRAVVTSNETYFVSPNYPNLITGRIDPPVCIFTLQRNPLIIKFPVCQIRIDFDEFSLAPHANGICGNSITDSFIVSGAANFNQSGLPITGLCGEMTGQHIYLDVDPEKTDDPLLLIVNTANQQEFNRKWSIRIRQIPCKSKYRAPPGCLQYFTALNGNIESFNYRTTNLPIIPPTITDTRIASNYLNNLNYGICIAKQPRTCAIRYSAIEFDIGGSKIDSSTPSDMCVTTNDGDFLLIPLGTTQNKENFYDRYCGQRLSASKEEAVMNQDVYSFISPFVVYVHTDNDGISGLNAGNVPQKGFLLKYQQVAC